MDIKIDAVFSLANANESIGSQNMMEQANQGWKPGTIKTEVHDPGFDFASPNTMDNQNKGTTRAGSDTDSVGEFNAMDWSTENDIKPFCGLDTPPNLSMEKETGSFRAMLFDSGLEYMAPPILVPQISTQPEIYEDAKDTSNDSTQRSKKMSMKIYPCYIVLSRLDKYLPSKARLSYRRFRRTFRECPNICKKFGFRRKLKAGFDVFNVKTPSKSKCYPAFSNMHANVQTRKSNPQKPRYKDLIKKYKDTVNGRGTERVMRAVHYMPKDFVKSMKKDSKSPAMARFLTDARQQVLDETEREIIMKRDLVKLKNQLAFKRSSNKTKKELRRHQTENMPTYLQTRTSLVSGRILKSNTRYGKDFARSKDELNLYQSLSVMEQKMKRDSKRIADECKEKLIDVSVDKTKCKLPQLTQEEKRLIQNARRREAHRQKKIEKSMKNVSNDNEDGVIIRDIPNEHSVLSNLLLSDGKTETQTKLETNVKAEKSVLKNTLNDASQYGFAKSLLMKNVSLANTIEDPNYNGVGTLLNTNIMNEMLPSDESTIDPERAKLLRIPEKVRRLFVKKKDGSPTKNTGSISYVVCPLSTDDSNVRTVQLNGGVQHSVKTVMPMVHQASPREPQTFIITSSGLAKQIGSVVGSVSDTQINTEGSSFPLRSTESPSNTVKVIHSNSKTRLAAQAVAGSKAIPQPAIGSYPQTVTGSKIIPQITKPIGSVNQTEMETGISPYSLIRSEKIHETIPSNHAGTTSARNLVTPLQASNDPPSVVPFVVLNSPANIAQALTSHSSNTFMACNPQVASQVRTNSIPPQSKNPLVLGQKTFVPVNPGPGKTAYYHFHVNGKNVLIPVNQMPNQQKGFVFGDVQQSGGTKVVHSTAQSKLVMSTYQTINDFSPSGIYSTGFKNSNAILSTAQKAPLQTDVVSTHSDSDKACKSTSYIHTVVPQGVNPLAPGSSIIGSKLIRVYPGQQTPTGMASVPSVVTLSSSVLNSQSVLHAVNNGKTSTTLASRKTGKVITMVKPQSNSKSPDITIQESVDSRIVPGKYNLVHAKSAAEQKTPVSSIIETTSSMMTVHASKLGANTEVGHISSVYNAHTEKPIVDSKVNLSTCKNKTYLKLSPVITAVVPFNRKELKSKTKSESQIKRESETHATKQIDEKVDEVEGKTVAFAEATTAREEKLKKLKALLKEQQMAVEKLRQERLNPSADSEDK